jgi:hypothetical protein
MDLFDQLKAKQSIPFRFNAIEGSAIEAPTTAYLRWNEEKGEGDIRLDGNYVGRDGVGEPHSLLTKKWLNQQKDISEVWYGTWQVKTAEAMKLFLNAIQNHIEKH